MGKAIELDKDLADGLKAAKSKRCYFALVLKGGTDGALIVSKTKIAAPAIAEAKKKSGGSAVVSGLVSYADGTYLFETAKLTSATAAQAVRTADGTASVCHRERGQEAIRGGPRHPGRPRQGEGTHRADRSAH